MTLSKILLADGETTIAHELANTLNILGFSVRVALDRGSAEQLVSQAAPDLLICDLNLPESHNSSSFGGLDFLESFRVTHPTCPVIIIAYDASAEMAIEATKRGAYDYLLKPLDMTEVAEVVRRAIRNSRLMSEPVQFDSENVGQAPLRSPGRKGIIVGRSRTMREVFKELGRVAAKPVTILIRGETGTGKELAARAIFQHGHRAHMPFIAVNCAAIPETLLESELFGHEKGAFTGADTRRIGRFEQANNGTIFLDEIGEISPGTQAKLLRVLQERAIQRLGGREDIPVDVRIIAATNRDLEAMIETREFRADLFFRLSVVTVTLPPLRERREDIPLLIKHFVELYAVEFSTPVSIGEDAVEYLSGLPWPGNIRQLENTIRRAILAARGFCITREVAEAVTSETAGGVPAKTNIGAKTTIDGLINARLEAAAKGERRAVYVGLLREFEREVLTQAIRLAGGNLSRAARWLGITRLTLREKLIQFGLHPRSRSSSRSDESPEKDLPPSLRQDRSSFRC